MDSGSFTHAAPSHVDTSTEWDDAQARLGNVKPKPKPAKPEKFTASFDDAGALASRRNDAVDASTGDGDDFDDDDDDAYVREYRARRMKELTAEATAKAHGEVREATRATFVAEVTRPSADAYVVVLMTRAGCRDCEKMERAFEILAAKFPRTKFVKIAHRECVPNYPDRLAPTVLVYRDEDVARTYATLAPFGGEHMTPEGVELALRETSADVCPSASDESEADVARRRAAYVAGVLERAVDAARREASADAVDDD